MTDASLTTELERVVAGVVGVERLYGSTPALGEAAAIARDLVRTGALVAPARIRLGDDHVVSVSVATDAAHPAREVARSVHDAVEAFMAERGLPLTRVDVRVAHVD